MHFPSHGLPARAAFALVGLCVTGVACPCRGGEADGHQGAVTFRGAYCGLYCVYAALRAEDVPVRLEELISPRYMGSGEGSSAAELSQAVSESGGHAVVLTRLSDATLWAAEHPTLLHVRRPGFNAPYSHWVLLLGVQGDGGVRLLDPPGAPAVVPMAELLACWDGTAIVVSRSHNGTWPLLAAGWIDSLVGTATVLVVLGLLRRSRRLRTGRWWGLLAIASASVGVAVGAHAVRAAGFFHNRAAVAVAAGHHFRPDVATCSVQAVRSVIGSPDVFVVDARLPQDYARDHLPGAVNLPVTAGPSERDAILGKARPRRAVVYCQSAGCSWAGIVAEDLKLRGFRDICVMSGGWQEWSDNERSEP